MKTPKTLMQWAETLSKGSRLQTIDPTGYDLATGQLWERALCRSISSSSEFLSAEQPKQNLGRDELRLYQRDLDLYRIDPDSDDIERSHIEVKSRSGDVWKYSDILVGSRAHWDSLRFVSGWVVVIEQKTGIARVTNADPISRLNWRQVQNRDAAYAIDRAAFIDFEDWLDAIVDRRI